MRMTRLIAAFTACMLVTGTAAAAWTAEAKVDQLNVGGNGMHGTFITMTGVSFTGCTNTSLAVMKGDNVNYKEFISFLLAAKMTDKAVKLSYSGCEGNYSIVREVVIK